MAEKFYAAAFWGPRAETAQSCAARLSRFLVSLADADPLLASWYRIAHSRVSCMTQPVRVHPQDLEALLAAGRNWRDDNGSVLPELGYSAWMWNGNDVEVGLRASCGMYSQRLANSVVVNLPKAEGAGAVLYRPTVARITMAALVECWQPDWATLSSYSLRRAQDPPPGAPVVGWMTYLAAARQVEPVQLPGWVTAEALPGGTLLTVADEVWDVTERAVVRLRTALGDSLFPPAGCFAVGGVPVRPLPF